ncbi:hypothetical protein [uncultured Reyranella sp.]|uniref:hypothetical protein n=1 Tax=uncultured Reyranella sp. TaxID=735512 RepID=UPI0025E993F5|nr:hypothetical protein [uncultured Reyranella sp.]
MWDRIKSLIDAVTLTRILATLIFGFAFWLMVIFTLEFAGVIDIDMQCGDRCMHLIDSIFSLIKPAPASAMGLDYEIGRPAAPLTVQVRFLP